MSEKITYNSDNINKIFFLPIEELIKTKSLSDNDLLKFADNILERKIKDECTYALFLIRIILLPVLVHIDKDLIDEYKLLLTEKKLMETYKELMIKSLTKAYKESNFTNMKHGTFWGILIIVFSNMLSFIFEYWQSSKKKINEKMKNNFYKYMLEAWNNKNFMCALTKLLDSKTLEGKKLLDKVLTMLEKSLLRRDYTAFQIEHIKSIISGANNDKSRFYKNDIIDNKVLQFCNDKTFILSFDKNIIKTVKKVSQQNYDFIESFLIT